MDLYHENGLFLHPEIFESKMRPNYINPVNLNFAMNMLVVSIVDLDSLTMTGSMLAAQIFYMMYRDELNGKFLIIIKSVYYYHYYICFYFCSCL